MWSASTTTWGPNIPSSPKKWDRALDVLRNRGLFFVDSLTTGQSAAYTCAREMGLSAKRRDLFIDNHREVSAVILQLKRLRNLAHRHGSAIGIGHPRTATAEAIMRFTDMPESRDVAFVYISQVL